MTNLVYNQTNPNEQKIGFHGIAHVFFGFISQLSKILNEILIFFLSFY